MAASAGARQDTAPQSSAPQSSAPGDLAPALERARAAAAERLPATVAEGSAEAAELIELRAPSLRTLEGADELELLALRDGALLFAAVLDHSPEGLEVRKLEDGGRLSLPWSLLDPAHDLELQKRYGYIAEEAEELLLSADVIPLSGSEPMVGRIELRTADTLHVKTRAGVTLLPTARISGAITQTLVPAGDLFTRDELYARSLEALGPQLAAGGVVRRDGLLELARQSESIGDHRHALEVWEQLAAGAGAGEYEAPEELEAALARSRNLAQLQDQADQLDEIDRMARRGRYADARLELGTWVGAYGDSDLAEDAERLRGRIEARAQRALQSTVERRFPYWTSRLVRAAARDLEQFESVEDAEAFLEETLPEQIYAALQQDVAEISEELSTEQLRAVWAARKGTRTRQASYGSASWLLGEERALAGFEREEEEEEELTGVAAERAELMERIQRYQRNNESLSGQLDTDDGLDPKEAWMRMSPSDRAQWMTAYFAEFSDEYELVRVRFQPHRACSGLGYFEVMDMGAQGARTRTVQDVHCGGLGKQRQVVYR